MSFVKNIYHIVFRTYRSIQAIVIENERLLYSYIFGFCNNKKCVLRRINGMPDHIHMLIEVPASLSIADFVKELKISSNFFLQSKKDLFPLFYGWAEGYASFTYSNRDIPLIKNYIANQKQHHLDEDFKSELINLLKENDIEVDDDDFVFKD